MVGNGPPATGSGSTGVCVGGTYTCGGVVAQEHVEESVQLGLRQRLPLQIIELGQSESVRHELPHDVCGVGLGLPQVQESTAVHPGRRQRFDSQIKSDGH